MNEPEITQPFLEMNTPPKPHGGARKGAGRKRGKKNVLATFSLPLRTVVALSDLPNKSRFVNEAILKAIGEQ